ncbi:MAG: hypothetical protein QOF76_5446 [Solirubrobacteraceae bacterium]|jgi:hypothetical protein|nr:hypothetical protein [Solirubrobacteraceae bacterium]
MDMRLRRSPLLAAGAAAVAFALPASPALANHSQFSVFEAPRELKSTDDSLRQATLDEIRAFGVTHVRVLINWAGVLENPESRSRPSGDATDPGAAQYDWSTYDKLIDEATDRGIEVIPTLTGPVPRWATAGKAGHNIKPNRNDFEKFVEAAGTRYADKVGTWTVWNEPNLSSTLSPQFVNRKPYSPLLYRALYQAAIQGLGASGNGGDQVLAGETAPRGNAPSRNSKGGAVPPVTFAKLFLKGKKLPMTGYSTHPYTTSTGPLATPKDKNTVSISSLGRLAKVLNQSGYKHLGLYLLEFGIQSRPDKIVGVPEAKQNDYRNISEKIAYDNPRVKAFSQYLMRDDYDLGAFQSGLRYADGALKASYTGYALPLVATRVKQKVRLWGLVRAGGSSVTVEQQDGGGEWTSIGDVSTNSRGYWTTSASFKKGRKFRAVAGEKTSPAASIY